MWIAASIPFWVLGAILAFLGVVGIHMVVRDTKRVKLTPLNVANCSVAIAMLLMSEILFAIAIKIVS